jgi:ABC-type transport system involved in cytochrome c biogenesis permease subunit
MTLDTELMILWAALIIYVLAGSLSIIAVLFNKRLQDFTLALICLGLTAHTAALGYRWVRLDHGPFLTMFEILSSNIWSLTLFFCLCYWRLPSVRPIAALIMPILFIMMGWLLLANPGEGFFPPTYDTVWLYVHIGFGKVFMGALLVAVGLSGLILGRRSAWLSTKFHTLPNSASLSELSFRFMALGLVFETLMLVAGAIWAQDAWGRYWAWDPLETWSFITWLILALSLHLRVTWKISPSQGAMVILVVFIIAFLTFFGVPFISMVPHKGAV